MSILKHVSKVAGLVFILKMMLVASLSASAQQSSDAYLDSVDQNDSQLQKRYFAREALETSKSNDNPEGMALAFHQLGEVAKNEGNTKKAEKYYSRAIEILEANDELIRPGKKAEIYKDYAENFVSRSAYNKALKYFIKSNQIAQKQGFKELEMHTARKIGNVYYFLDDYEKSSEYYYQALSIARKIDNTEGVTYALNNIASNIDKTGNTEKALEMYKEALKIAQKNNLVEAIGILSNNIGSIYLQEGAYDSALDQFNMGLSYANKTNDFRSLAAYNNNIATVYMKKEKYDEARKFFMRSYYDYKKIGNRQRLAGFNLNYAELMMKTGKLDSALIYMEKARQLNQELNSTSLTSMYYEMKHLYYMQVDSFQKALQAYKQHTSLDDSLVNLRTREKIHKLNKVYAEQEQQLQLTKLQEQQEKLRVYLWSVVGLAVLVISVIIWAFVGQRKWNTKLKKQNLRFISQQRELAQKNKELQESQEKLEEVNKDRNQLFSIISHDLRSPFNSLLGFSEMLVEEVREGRDFDSIEMMTENIYKSSMQLFELIQNLLEWANSERGKIQFKPEKIIMHKIANENIRLASHTARQKGVNIINDINRKITVNADLNMLNTILRNLIFNSVKFTARNGYVKLYAEDRENDVKVSIEDNGMGMSKEEKERILYSEDTFSKEGTNKEKGAGLGLVLVKNFLKKHDGQLEIESTLNKGTAFSFTIPKTNSH